MFIATNDIITAAKVALLALQLPATYAAVADYPKAFTSVEVYRNENLITALQDLFNYDDRVCLIVPGGDEHENLTQGTNLLTARTSSIVLLICDQDYSKSQAELVGGPDAVGVIALKDLVVVNLFGSNLGISRLALAPTSGEPLRISDKERADAPARDCWAQTFTTPAGAMKAPIIR